MHTDFLIDIEVSLNGEKVVCIINNLEPEIKVVNSLTFSATNLMLPPDSSYL